MTIPTNISLIATLEELYEVNGKPSASTQAKFLSQLEAHSKDFIHRSPFLVMATGAGGQADASPRGDDPGFVKVLDDTTLLIPERPGNRIADTLSNVLGSPAVGLIFMIPGMNETLRINGNAFVTNEPEYLAMLIHSPAEGKPGKPPKLAFVVDVQQVFFHCAKAFIRSKLWNPEFHMARSDMPTLGKILLEQIKQQAVTDDEAAMLDAGLVLDIKENLYD